MLVSCTVLYCTVYVAVPNLLSMILIVSNKSFVLKYRNVRRFEDCSMLYSKYVFFLNILVFLSNTNCSLQPKAINFKICR
jgi:hypothetical protein